jgi:hypothetical protein
MRACGHFAMRLAGLLGIALAVVSAYAGAVATGTEKSEAPQVVMLLPGRSLLEHRLPAFMEVQPGRYLAASALQHACTMPSLRADSLLLFLPDLQLCVQVTVPEQVALRQRLQQLTGRWPIEDPLVRLRGLPFLAIAPAPPKTDGPKAPCTCNTPPDGVAMCGAQTHTTGTPISTVEYLASDTDNDALTGTFSYQHDADPVQSGLPSPLTSMCTPSPGALQCTINGNAPAQPGILQLMLTVSDGISVPDLQLTSLLQVLAASDRIFANGLEDPATSSCSAQP